jgi:hypothetical protein
MPRGGRRPGAGAPKGNWNALSTGRRSKRIQALVLALRNDPQFLVVYRLLTEAASRKQRRDQRTIKETLVLTCVNQRNVGQGQQDSPAPWSIRRGQGFRYELS